MESVLLTVGGPVLLGVAVFIVIYLISGNVIRETAEPSAPQEEPQLGDLFYCNYNLFEAAVGRKLDVVMERISDDDAIITITEAPDWGTSETVEEYRVNAARFESVLAIVKRFEMDGWQDKYPSEINRNNQNEISVQIQGKGCGVYCDECHMPRDGQAAFREILETMTRDLGKIA